MKRNLRILLLASVFAGGLTSCALAKTAPTAIPTDSPQPPRVDRTMEVDSFETCVAAGNPIMESYPQQCRGPDGEVYIEDIGNELEKLDLIRVDNPRPNTVIQSPLQIAGQARGTWFFEADFPIELLTEDGAVIGRAIAHAEGEWMTEDFVPFNATLSFTTPEGGTGTLLLIKDNPSGQAELDDVLRIPVKFASE